MKNKLEPEEFEQLPVGDTFILGNTELEVVAQIGCTGCFLDRGGGYIVQLCKSMELYRSVDGVQEPTEIR